MKRINVVSEFWPPEFIGGGEISTFLICEELVKRGYKITILTPNVPEKKYKNFKYIKLNNPPNFLAHFEKRFFESISIKEPFPKGIYWASDFYGAAFLNNKKVKKIATVRDYWPICSCGDAVTKDFKICYERSLKSVLNCNKIYNTSFFLRLPRIIKYLKNFHFRKNILSKFNNIVFISNFLKDKILFEVPINNYSVVYNPLSQDYIEKPLLSKNKNSGNILFAGAVMEYKGVSTLIKAFGEVLKKRKDNVVLLIAGKIYDNYQDLVKLLGIEDNIKFLNMISRRQIIDYYDQVNIVVIPSQWYEPFGRTIIEGMARKCIPIATNQGGPKEIIKDGRTGFLFEKGDYKQLSRIIIDLLENPNRIESIQKKVREFSINYFSPEKITDQYESIFNNY